MIPKMNTGIHFSSENLSVGDPSSQYQSMLSLWTRARAIINGQRFCKQYDDTLDSYTYSNLLLPFSPSMSPEQYEFYKAEAELPGLTSQYAKALVGGMLRKGVKLELPLDVPEGCEEWLTHSFTGENKSIHHFLDEALWEDFQTSRAWVIVDYPEVQRDLTVEEQKSLSPYPVLYKAEHIINWKTGTHPVTGATSLTQLIVRSYASDYSDNEFHPTYKDVVYVYDLPNGQLRVRIYEREIKNQGVPIINGEIQNFYNPIGGSTNENSWVLKRTIGEVLVQGEPMTMIPAFPLNGSIEPQEPILQNLIDREIGLYNKISRRNHLLYGAATYTPVVSSDMSDEEFQEIVDSGLGSWLKVRADEKISALETPTAALKDMETAISSTIQDMAKLGIRMLNPEGNIGSSGVALEIRNASQAGQLANLNRKISFTMQKIICLMINWKYGTKYEPSQIDFELSGDFNPAPLGENWMRLVTEWYSGGLIPRSTFIEVMKQNDILPYDYDDREGRNEISGDDLIVPVREQFDTDLELKEAAMKAKTGNSDPSSSHDISSTGNPGIAKEGVSDQGSGSNKPVRERMKTFNDGSGSPER